jgi:hypothetical protein
MTERRHHPCATTVWLDRDKFRRFFWLRRTPLSHVGPMVNKCSGLASALVTKGHMSFWTADDIASEFGLHVTEFIEQVGTEAELERLRVM